MEKLNKTIDTTLHDCILSIQDAKTLFVEHYGLSEVYELIDALDKSGFESKTCEILLNEKGEELVERLNKIREKAKTLSFDKISANDASDFLKSIDSLSKELDYCTRVLNDDDEAEEGKWTTYGADIIQANEVIPEYYSNINYYVDKITDC